MTRDALWTAPGITCFAVQLPLLSVLWTFGFVLNHEVVVRYTYNEIPCVLDSVYLVTGVGWFQEKSKRVSCLTIAERWVRAGKGQRCLHCGPLEWKTNFLCAHDGQMHKCLVLVSLKKISADNFALFHTYSR